MNKASSSSACVRWLVLALMPEASPLPDPLPSCGHRSAQLAWLPLAVGSEGQCVTAALLGRALLVVGASPRVEGARGSGFSSGVQVPLGWALLGSSRVSLWGALPLPELPAPNGISARTKTPRASSARGPLQPELDLGGVGSP